MPRVKGIAGGAHCPSSFADNGGWPSLGGYLEIQINGKDIVTCVLLIGAFVLRAIGINTITGLIIIAIAVGYLGLSVPAHLPKRRQKDEEGKES